MNFNSKLGILRVLALLEGLSYIAFAITMPLKYNMDILMPNKIMGYAHGFLFLAYCIYVLIVGTEKKWDFKTIFLAGIASIIPFGTFVADAKIFKPQQLSQKV